MSIACVILAAGLGKRMKAGYPKVYVLKGGWIAWEMGKNPVEPK
mgnify:CR=1 FL=1